MVICAYGNCQLSFLLKKLKNNFQNLKIISPKDFDIKTQHPWEDNVFFPKTIFKNEKIFEALESCDLLIAQDVTDQEYWATKELIDYRNQIGKHNNIIVTNFYFDYKNPEDSINNLQTRAEIICKKYDNKIVDMTPWIKQNYSKFNISVNTGNLLPHPSSAYYEALSERIINLVIPNKGFELSLSELSHQFFDRKPLIQEINNKKIYIKNEPKGFSSLQYHINEITAFVDSEILYPNIVVLDLNHIEAYGHIHTEVLPELIAVDNTYPDADCVIVPYSNLIKKIVDFFKLPLSKKIKFIPPNDTLELNFQKLKIITHRPVSYPNKSKNVAKLKEIYHTQKPIKNKNKNLLLYCSRNSTAARHGRKLNQENEDQIIILLKDYATHNNLEFYLLTGLEENGSQTSLEKQYELFSNAKLVVAPHGGVLTNLIFLDPSKNPIVIEFLYKDFSFNDLFDGAILKFAKYYTISYQYPLPYSNLNLDNESTINLNKLKCLLDILIK